MSPIALSLGGTRQTTTDLETTIQEIVESLNKQRSRRKYMLDVDVRILEMKWNHPHVMDVVASMYRIFVNFVTQNVGILNRWHIEVLINLLHLLGLNFKIKIR